MKTDRVGAFFCCKSRIGSQPLQYFVNLNHILMSAMIYSVMVTVLLFGSPAAAS